MSEELKALPVGVRRVVHELRLSMQVLRDYGYQHQDKAESADDPKERAEREWKAKRNFDRAAACEDALDFFAASRTPTEAEPVEAEVEPVEAEEWSLSFHGSPPSAFVKAGKRGLPDSRRDLAYFEYASADLRSGHGRQLQTLVNEHNAALRSTTPASDDQRRLDKYGDPHAGIIAEALAPAVAVDDDALVERLRTSARHLPHTWTARRELIVEAADRLQSLQASVRELQCENDRLSKAVTSGILGDLLTPDENEALVEFVKTLRGAALSDQQGGE